MPFSPHSVYGRLRVQQLKWSRSKAVFAPPKGRKLRGVLRRHRVRDASYLDG